MAIPFSIGCVEICGAGEWYKFCDVVKKLSGKPTEDTAVATKKIKAIITEIPRLSINDLTKV
jgi:hypothetical protein